MFVYIFEKSNKHQFKYHTFSNIPPIVPIGWELKEKLFYEVS
jgi:hypothetical protein